MDNGEEAESFDPELIARVALVSSTKQQQHDREFEPHQEAAQNGEHHLKHLKLTPDGTSLIAVSVSKDPFSNSVTTTVLPPDLLTAPRPVTVEPYCEGTVQDPIRAIDCYPLYDLSNTSTNLALLSIADQPIRLINTLCPGLRISASYKYINPQTEAFISPYSLLFMPDGEYFITGADSELGIFNAHRDGEGPTETYRFKNRSNGGRSQWGLGRGIISTLDMSCDGYLAAGSWSSKVAIYSSQGRGDCITTFSIQGTGTVGSGISQVKWSSCGNYLYIAQRMSDDILVFDIRGQQRLVQTLKGRNTKSMLPHHFEVKDDSLFCGGLDGVVRIWNRLGKTEGDVEPTLKWQAHAEACTWIRLHPLASVAITGCARDRHKSGSVELSDSSSTYSVSDMADISEDESASASSSQAIHRQTTDCDTSDGTLARTTNNHIKVWDIQR